MVFKNYCKSKLFFVKIIDLPQATLISKQIKNQNYRKDFAEGEVNLESLYFNAVFGTTLLKLN